MIRLRIWIPSIGYIFWAQQIVKSERSEGSGRRREGRDEVYARQRRRWKCHTQLGKEMSFDEILDLTADVQTEK